MEVYEISGKNFDQLKRPMWMLLGKRKTKVAAVNLAMKKSKSNSWEEIDIRGFDEEWDLIFHAYYNDGVEFNMNA